MIKTKERGWPGHFIGAASCHFRRNTLIEDAASDTHVVVSTVGNYISPVNNKVDTIGFHRYYETMVFYAKYDGIYWDADVTKQIYLETKWGIDRIDKYTDQEANEMHDNIVNMVVQMMNDGTLPLPEDNNDEC